MADQQFRYDIEDPETQAMFQGVVLDPSGRKLPWGTVSVPIDPDAVPPGQHASVGPGQREYFTLTVMLYSATGLTGLDPQDLVQLFDHTDPEFLRQWTVFAVVDQSGDQVSADAFGVGARHGIQWDHINKPFRFDVVTEACEATLHILARRSGQSPDTNHVVRLGVFHLGPFPEAGQFHNEHVRAVEGTGVIDVMATVERKPLAPVEESAVWRIDRHSFTPVSGLRYATNAHSGRTYLITSVPFAQYRHGSMNSSRTQNFLAPVKFAFRSDATETLHLLAPVSGGGHLLAHVQRDRRLAVERTKAYAVQLVALLESFHARDPPVVGALQVESIMLDSLGKISVFAPAYFNNSDESPATREASPPECMPGRPSHPVVDWWTLGVLLYEMLAGMPPFCRRDAAAGERGQTMIGSVLEIPAHIPSEAKDILSRLLERDPAARLGAANGAADVKGHGFFRAINWLQLRYEKPKGIVAIDPDIKFATEPFRQRDHMAFSTSRPGFDDFRPDTSTNVSGPPSPAKSQDSDTEIDATYVCYHDEDICCHELREIKKRGRVYQRRWKLKKAIERSYDSTNVARMLDHRKGATLLSEPLFHVKRWGAGDFELEYPQDEVPITALEYAAELGRSDLVRLFLERGAGADLAPRENEGPALVRAARKGKVEVVDILCSHSSRVSRIRALCSAVDMGFITVATALLGGGRTLCDFQKSDYPYPDYEPEWKFSSSIYYGPRDQPRLAAADFVPPLVRAVRAGNVDMVRLLLEHGADVNRIFHDLCVQSQLLKLQNGQTDRDSERSPMIRCGRPVQMAMELGYQEIVKILLEYGAAVDFPHENWRPPTPTEFQVPTPRCQHSCLLIPRSVYLDITSGLEAAARERD